MPLDPGTVITDTAVGLTSPPPQPGKPLLQGHNAETTGDPFPPPPRYTTQFAALGRLHAFTLYAAFYALRRLVRCIRTLARFYALRRFLRITPLRTLF